MGTCTIESHIGDGEYEVTLHRDEVRLQIIIDHFTARNVILTTDAIPAAETDLETVETTLEATTAAMNLLIEAYRTAWNTWNSDQTDANKTARDDALKAVVAATAQYNKDSIPVVEAARALELLKQEKIDNAQKIGMAQDRQESAPEIRNIYCVDLADGVQGYDELATGSVFNTIEIDAVGEKILLASAYPDAFVPTPVDDGLQYVGANTAEGWLYNLIGYPGMLKWQPQYGQGSIKNIDYENNTCTVYRYLTQTAIGIMPEGQNWPYSGVAGDIEECPVKYLDCNAMAFEVGDLVVLEFLGNKTPTVIGFVDGPKPCGPNVPIQIYDFTDEKFFSLYVAPDGLWYRRNDSGGLCGSSYWTNVTTGTTVSCMQHKSYWFFDWSGAYYELPHAGNVYKDGAFLLQMPPYDGYSHPVHWSPIAAAEDADGRILIAANFALRMTDPTPDIRKKSIYKYENSSLTRIYFEDGQFEWDAVWNQDADELHNITTSTRIIYAVNGDSVTVSSSASSGDDTFVDNQTGEITSAKATGELSVYYGCVWSSTATARSGLSFDDLGSHLELQLIVAESTVGDIAIDEKWADREPDSQGATAFNWTPRVLRMPSGHYVGISTLGDPRSFLASISYPGDVATLIPEIAAEHKMCLVGFTDGWSFD